MKKTLEEVVVMRLYCGGQQRDNDRQQRDLTFILSLFVKGVPQCARADCSHHLTDTQTITYLKRK